MGLKVEVSCAATASRRADSIPKKKYMSSDGYRY